MQITIREMQIEDAVAVNFLSNQLGYSLSVEDTTKQIEKILSQNDHIAFVATDNDDNIIAWIHAFQSLYIESLSSVEIGGLVVDELYRGKGIGKALVNKIKEWCIKQNIVTLRVRTQLKRLDAHTFYKALQFEEIKEQKVFQQKLKSKKRFDR